MLDPATISRNKPDFDRPWYKPALTLIKKYGKKRDILELGCGLGEFSAILSKEKYNVVCADGSKKYIDKVRGLGFCQAICCDFNNSLPYKDNSFSFIVSLEVIEHLENAEGFIKEIYRILKPGGYLVISTPNIAYIGLRLRGLLGVPPPDEGYHFRFFTFNTLKQILINEGFSYVDHRSFTFVHGAHKVLNRKPIRIQTPLFPNISAVKSVVIVKKSL